MNPNRIVVGLTVAFFALAVALRVIPHDYNLTAIGALGLYVGFYWSATAGMLFVLAAMGISDLIGQWAGVPSMGVYDVKLMLVVYGAMALSGLIGRAIASPVMERRPPVWVGVPIGAAVASLTFFLITNFAVWLGPISGYPRTWGGLIECYVAAVPFAKSTVAGNFLFSALFFACHSWATRLLAAADDVPATAAEPKDGVGR